MIAHNIYLTVFIKEGEDLEKTKESFVKLVPFDLEENKIKIESKKAKGFDEKEINILTINIENQPLIKQFLAKLQEKLSDETKSLILKQVESRTDEDCRFYLRFSKEKFMKNEEYFITDQGNCFHIKITVAAFPKKREKAIEIISKIFKPTEEM